MTFARRSRRPAPADRARPAEDAEPGTAGSLRDRLVALQRSHGNRAAEALMVQLQAGPDGTDPLAGIENDAAIAEELVRGAAIAEARPLFERGRRAFRRGRYREAARLFEEAGAIVGPNDELLWNAAVAYRRVYETEGRPPDNPNAIAAARRAFQAGVDAHDAGDLRAALASFQESFRLLPNPEVLYNVGIVYYRLGAYADAREQFLAYAAGTGSSAAAGLLAECVRRIAGGASPVTESAIEAIEASEADALDAILEEANRTEARRTFERAVERYRAGEQGAAAAAFEWSAALDPRIAWEAAYNAGVAYLDVDQPARALEAFKRGLGLP